MGGGLGITKLYRFKAVLSSRKDRYLYLEKPVRIDEIEFRPAESWNKLNVFFNVMADTDMEATSKAEKFIDNLCTAILLSTNIAVDVDSINVVRIDEIQETSKSDARRTVIIVVHDVIKLKAEVSVGLGLDESLLKSIIGIAGKITGFNELVNRFFRWYRWGLLEKDPIDRFIKLWIAFEIWTEYRGYKKGEESEKTKMINALMKECKVDEKEADEMYGTRCSIFHSGVHDKALNKLSQLEKCLQNVILGIRQNASQQFANLE